MKRDITENEWVIEYRAGCDSLLGKKQKVSGQQKIELYMLKPSRRP